MTSFNPLFEDPLTNPVIIEVLGVRTSRYNWGSGPMWPGSVCVQERVSVWVCALDSPVTPSRNPSLRPALLLRPRPLEVREGEHEDQYGAREHLLLGDTRSCPSSLPRA